MKRQSFLVVSLLLLMMPLWSQSILMASNLTGCDNSLELTFNEDGIIAFIKATFQPGPGITTIYERDIVDEDWEMHDVGTAKNKDIIMTSESTYKVIGQSDPPAMVYLGNKSISLTLGREYYRITKPGDFLVEAWPMAGGNIDTQKRTAYRIAQKKEGAFQGFVEEKWKPGHDFYSADIDGEAMCYPKECSFINGELKATAYAFDIDYAILDYDYRITLSKQRKPNLENYLILLTQRGNRGRGEFPIIHPVLLTLYYFDALMARN